MANVNNYIAAGRSAVRKNLTARKALSDNKPDYGALGQEAIKAERDKKIAVIQANAKVANAAQTAMTKVEGAEISADEKRSITKSENTARKAGMLASGAAKAPNSLQGGAKMLQQLRSQSDREYERRR